MAKSRAESAAKLQNINLTAAKLADNVKKVIDASANVSAQEFSSLQNITSSFLDSFHSMIDISQKYAMAGLRELSNSTAFLTKEMSKNTMYTTTAAGASSASLAMAILVMLAIALVRLLQVRTEVNVLLLCPFLSP